MYQTQLYHHGIKGQKWGVRNGPPYPLSESPYNNNNYRRIQTLKGEVLSITKAKRSNVNRFLSKHFKSVRQASEKEINFDVRNKNGIKVGNVYLQDVGNGTLNGNWINIDKKHQGKGYATAVVKDMVRYAKENGYKKMTLEVPGNSPDARHIYEKIGFKSVKSLSSDDVWNGLTAMELDLTNNLKHGGNKMYNQNELYHHGILGMKWGKRNGPPYPLGAGNHSASEKKAESQKSVSGTASSLQKTQKRSNGHKSVTVANKKDGLNKQTALKNKTTKRSSSKKKKPADPGKFINDYKKTVQAYQAMSLS